MTAAERSPSTSLLETASAEEALAYYKSQYEQLEHELAEFQASSRELETELEKDVEASEQRERKLKEKVEGLGFEVDEWKVSYRVGRTIGEYERTSDTMANAIMNRLNTSSASPKQMRYKGPFKRRSRFFEIPTGRRSSDYATSRWPMMISSAKLGIRPPRSRILNQNTMWPLSELSCSKPKSKLGSKSGSRSGSKRNVCGTSCLTCGSRPISRKRNCGVWMPQPILDIVWHVPNPPPSPWDYLRPHIRPHQHRPHPRQHALLHLP